MIALYILAALVLLVVLILSLNLHFSFRYQNGFSVTLRILFIKFSGTELLQLFEKKEEPPAPEPAPEEPKKKRRKGTLSDFLDFLRLITEVLTEALRDFGDHAHVRLKTFECRIAQGDACTTALLTGAVTEAVNAVFALLCRFTDFRWDREKLVLCPDFQSAETAFRFHLVLRIRLFSALRLVLKAYLHYQEGKEQ